MMMPDARLRVLIQEVQRDKSKTEDEKRFLIQNIMMSSYSQAVELVRSKNKEQRLVEAKEFHECKHYYGRRVKKQAPCCKVPSTFYLVLSADGFGRYLWIVESVTMSILIMELWIVLL